MARKSPRIAAKLKSQRRTQSPAPSSSSSSSKKTKSKKDHHGKTFHYEFGGPIGAFFTMVSLPVVVYGLYFACNGDYCVNFTNYENFPIPQSLCSLWNTNAFLVTCAWIGLHVVLERFLPGDVAEGVPLKHDGSRLKYPLNGHLAFWISMAIMIFTPSINFVDGSSSGSLFDLSYAYDHYVHLATSALVIAVVMTIYLYARSFRKDAVLAPHGNSGNFIYDAFIGRELNPRILKNFDLKYFFELRPGLVGWALINAGCLVKQYQLQGSVSGAMILVNLFQGLYVWDALFQERAILTTMDIINDGFGFMLAFGDVCWVPFTYSLQARYLVEHKGATGNTLILIAALNIVGYWIFRGSNGQKDAFRRDPNSESVKHLETLTTKSGRKLIVSGWWGMARKINYTGDWIMGLSWCLYTGFDSIIPYFYAIYFAILLIHRAFRDDETVH